MTYNYSIKEIMVSSGIADKLPPRWAQYPKVPHPLGDKGPRLRMENPNYPKPPYRVNYP